MSPKQITSQSWTGKLKDERTLYPRKVPGSNPKRRDWTCPHPKREESQRQIYKKNPKNNKTEANQKEKRKIINNYYKEHIHWKLKNLKTMTLSRRK